MDHKQALKDLMETYYQITLGYRKTTIEAMAENKRRAPFKKKDFSPYILRFSHHKEEAEKLDVKAVAIPEGDEKARELAELFERSVTSFILLCEENIRFYDIVDKKQYRRNKISLKEYTDSITRFDGVLSGAMRELEKLETAYKEYCGGDFAD